jgi:cell division protein FtsQ
MMPLNPLWRRNARKSEQRAAVLRKPAVSPARRWEGVAAGLRAALIMAAGLVLAGILGWGWATLTDPRLLPIKSVQVRGPFTHVDAQTVRAVAAPWLTGNFLTVDIRRVQQVVQSLPWVRRADVRRAWPDAVRITVTEQLPVANWGEDGLVNDAGEIFKPPRDSYPPGLPALRGPEGSGKAVVTAFQDMNAMVAPLNLHIVSVTLDERRAWSLELDNGIQVIMGRGNGYERVLRFVRFYRRALRDQEAAVERVDLRYSNGFAVRWKHAGTRDAKPKI